MLDKIKGIITFRPEVVARASYGLVLVLLMIVGIQSANLSYYKSTTSKLFKLSQTTVETNKVISAKLRVLENHYYELDQELSVYEVELAEQYHSKLMEIERVDGVRKNIIFINYLSAIKMNSDYVKLIAGAFHDASLKYDIDARELIATAWHESRFRPKSLSHVGATGVMQIMELWLKNDNFIFENDIYCREDLLDPVKNIQAGAYIYNHYKSYWKRRGYQKDHNVRRLALLSYNRGRGRVSSLMRNGINPANGYFRVISKKYNKLKILEEKMI